MAHKKKSPSEIRTNPELEGQAPTCYPTLVLVYIDRDWYISIRTNRRLRYLDQKQKQHPLPGEDASTAEAASGRVGTGGQGEARRTNAPRNGGPHLELGRLRL